MVKCKFDCPKAFDPEAEIEMRLVVPAPGLKIEPGEYGEAEHSEEADLRLWLPRLEWAEAKRSMASCWYGRGRTCMLPRCAWS